MLNSSFFTLLTTLSNQEVLSFHQFVSVANAKQQVPNRLLSYVVSHGTNEAAWKKLSVEQAYLATFDQPLSTEKHRKKLFNTFGVLNTWLTSYLVWKEVNKPSLWRQYILSNIYFERGLTESFDKTLKQSIKLIKSIPNSFLQPFFLMMFYHVSYFNSTAIDVKKSLKLKSALKYLEEFYLQTKLRYVGELVNTNNLLGDSQDFSVPANLLDSSSQEEYKDNNYVQLYYWVLRLSEDRNDIAFKKVKHYFNLISFTDKAEEEEILGHLLNFCTYAIRQGDRSYLRESFNLYKEAIAANRLDSNLTGISFFNIVTQACFFEELNWADDFINNYGKNKISADAKDYVCLSKVRIFIQRKQYEEALNLLIVIRSKIFHIEKTRRALQIKCLVELKESPDIILNHCSNFLLYLKRDKMSSQENKKSFINYIKAVQKLQKKIPKQALIDFVNTTSPMVYKNWVTEWIEEL